MSATISSLFHNCDLLGQEAKLYTSNGKLRHVSLFGGVLSILMVALITAGSLVFTYQFFNREEFTLISNEIQNKDVSYKGLSSIPLLFRISAGGSKIFEDPEQIYRMRLAVSSFNSSFSSIQTSVSFPMEICSLEKDVDLKYRNLFIDRNFTSVSTYLCPNFNSTNVDLTGLYGSIYEYTYITVIVDPCIQSLGYLNCKPEREVRSYLSGSYIDFTTITYQINHNSIIPETPDLYSERIGISSTIFKRIWFQFQEIDYSTDLGYIFNDFSTEVFNQAIGYSQESDLKDVSTSSFLWFTIINNRLTKSYKRSFMKAQTLLSNVGGIINGLHILGISLTYIVSMNMFSNELIKRLVRINLKVEPNASNIHLYVQKIPDQIPILKIENSNMSSCHVLHITDNCIKENASKRDYGIFQMLLPYACWCNSRYRKEFGDARSKINNLLSVFELVTQLQKFELLYDLVLEEQHKILIGQLLDNQENSSQLLECINKIQFKPEKSLIDRNILMKLRS